MAYQIIATKESERLIEGCIDYILNTLIEPAAASHFVDELDKLYSRLEDNPFQFRCCSDESLANLGYRECQFSSMNYRLIFRIENELVYIVAVYHYSEDFISKLKP